MAVVCCSRVLLLLLCARALLLRPTDHQSLLRTFLRSFLLPGAVLVGWVGCGAVLPGGWLERMPGLVGRCSFSPASTSHTEVHSSMVTLFSTANDKQRRLKKHLFGSFTNLFSLIPKTAKQQNSSSSSSSCSSCSGSGGSSNSSIMSVSLKVTSKKYSKLASKSFVYINEEDFEELCAIGRQDPGSTAVQNHGV